MYAKCWVCQADVAEQLTHEHHKRPQAAGGGPADKIVLCAGCHNNTHAIANMLLSQKNASKAEDVVRQAYPDPGAQKRMFELSKLIVEWMRTKNEGLVGPADMVRLVVHLPPKAKLALKTMATDRKVGMEKYIQAILIEHILQKYPNLRQEIQPKRK